MACKKKVIYFIFNIYFFNFKQSKNYQSTIKKIKAQGINIVNM